MDCENIHSGWTAFFGSKWESGGYLVLVLMDMFRIKEEL